MSSSNPRQRLGRSGQLARQDDEAQPLGRRPLIQGFRILVNLVGLAHIQCGGADEWAGLDLEEFGLVGLRRLPELAKHEDADHGGRYDQPRDQRMAARGREPAAVAGRP